MKKYRLSVEKETYTQEELRAELNHYHSAMEKELTQPYKERLQGYEHQELTNKLKGKIKEEFINDFISLKNITNNMDEKELNSIIDSNSQYKIQEPNNIQTKINNPLDKVISGKTNPSDTNLDFDPDNPYGDFN